MEKLRAPSKEKEGEGDVLMPRRPRKHKKAALSALKQETQKRGVCDPCVRGDRVTSEWFATGEQVSHWYRLHKTELHVSKEGERTCDFGRIHTGQEFCYRSLDRPVDHGACADGHDDGYPLVYESCEGKLYCEECPENWG